MADVLLYEKLGHIVRITLNRPEKRNAIDPEMMVKLGQAWIDFEKDEDLRVAIVTGAGGHAARRHLDNGHRLGHGGGCRGHRNGRAFRGGVDRQQAQRNAVQTRSRSKHVLAHCLAVAGASVAPEGNGDGTGACV